MTHHKGLNHFQIDCAGSASGQHDVQYDVSRLTLSHAQCEPTLLCEKNKTKNRMPVGNLLFFVVLWQWKSSCKVLGCEHGRMSGPHATLIKPVYASLVRNIQTSSLLEFILGLWLFLPTYRGRYWFCCWIVALLTTLSSSHYVNGHAPAISMLFRWSWETEQTLQLRI